MKLCYIKKKIHVKKKKALISRPTSWEIQLRSPEPRIVPAT